MRLNGLILWPDREALQNTMPQSFQRSFGKKVAVIFWTASKFSLKGHPTSEQGLARGLITSTTTQ